MPPVLEDTLIAAVLIGGLVAALEMGFRSGRRAARGQTAAAGGQVGAVQGAALGLLGLLLAFSFAASGARFLEKQDLITEEANAIGTCFLRADLLDEPRRSELRAALRRYTEHRVETSAKLRRGLDPAVAAEVEGMHAAIWSAAVAGVTDRPASMLAVLPTVNEVIDLHSVRVAAGKKHIPTLVMGLLIACSALAIGVIGYGCGTDGHRRAPMTLPLAILIGTALWITIDLDHPRGGLLQLSDAPLQALKLDAPPTARTR